MNARLVSALRSRGVKTTTVLDSRLAGKTDAEQLAFATDLGCVLYTFNVPDFHRIHHQRLAAGRSHAGIILVPQQRFSIGEQLRRTLRLCATVTAEGTRNRAEFLGLIVSRPGLRYCDEDE